MVLEMKPETGFGHMTAEVSLEWEDGILTADIQVNNADENKPLRAYLKNGADYFYLGLLVPYGTTAALKTQKACADAYGSMFLCIGRADEEYELVMSGRIKQETEDEVEGLDETVAEMETVPDTEMAEDNVAIEEETDQSAVLEVEEMEKAEETAHAEDEVEGLDETVAELESVPDTEMADDNAAIEEETDQSAALDVDKIEEAEDAAHVEVEEEEKDGVDETDETLRAEEEEITEDVETAQASSYLGVEWKKCLPEELNCQSEAEVFMFSHPSVKANLKFYGHYCRAELDRGTVYAFASTFGPHALPHLAKYAYWHDVDLGFGHKGYFLIGLKGDEYFFVR